MSDERRLAELLERVVAYTGLVSAALSASEWHELAEGFRPMVTVSDGTMSLVYRLCDALEHRDAFRNQVDRLTARRDELLALVARLSQETPLPDELKGWESARAAMLAEIGTLRSALRGQQLVTPGQFPCDACGKLIWKGWFAISDRRIKCGGCARPQRPESFPFDNHDPGDEDPRPLEQP